MRTIPSIAPFMALTYASIGAVHPPRTFGASSLRTVRRVRGRFHARRARRPGTGGGPPAAARLARVQPAPPPPQPQPRRRHRRDAAARSRRRSLARPFCASAWLCPHLWRLAAGGKPPRAEPKRSPLTPAQARRRLCSRGARGAQRTVSDGCALRGVLPQVIRNWQMHIGGHGHGRSHRH